MGNVYCTHLSLSLSLSLPIYIYIYIHTHTHVLTYDVMYQVIELPKTIPCRFRESASSSRTSPATQFVSQRSGVLFWRGDDRGPASPKASPSRSLSTRALRDVNELLGSHRGLRRPLLLSGPPMGPMVTRREALQREKGVPRPARAPIGTAVCCALRSNTAKRTWPRRTGRTTRSCSMAPWIKRLVWSRLRG